MITAIVMLVFSFVLSSIALVLALITWAIPSAFQTAVYTLVTQYAGYAQGFFPVANTLQVISTFLEFLMLWYGFKMLLMLFHFVPGLGKHIEPPSSGKSITDKS